jgi:hypothetical protein
MLDSLKMIVELFRVFSFTLLGITLCVAGYALLQVFLHGVTAKARHGWDDASTQNEDHREDTSIHWQAFPEASHASTGFTRHTKR